MAIRRSEHLVGTKAEWEALDPILPKGQLALEIPANVLKVGNGAQKWTLLPYATASPTGDGMFDGGSP